MLFDKSVRTVDRKVVRFFSEKFHRFFRFLIRAHGHKGKCDPAGLNIRLHVDTLDLRYFKVHTRILLLKYRQVLCHKTASPHRRAADRNALGFFELGNLIVKFIPYGNNLTAGFHILLACGSNRDSMTLAKKKRCSELFFYCGQIVAER